MTIDELIEELCELSSTMCIICTAVHYEAGTAETDFQRSLPATLDGIYKRLDTLWGEAEKLGMEVKKNGKE